MKLVKKLSRIFDGILEAAALAAQVITGFVVILVSTDVFLRYFLRRPIGGSVEITEFSLLFIVFLGAARVLKRNKHVAMEFVLDKLKPSTRDVVVGVNSLLCGVALGIITWYAVLLVLDDYQIGNRYSSSIEIYKFPIRAVIPMGSFLLFIQFLRIGFRCLVNRGASPIRKLEVGEEIGV